MGAGGPAAWRGFSARADELYALTACDGPGTRGVVRVPGEDRRTVRAMLASRARDWLGHTVAIFTCGELGLAEAVPLPCRLQERAVLAARPHVRPLLAALQRCPAYRVVVVDRRHAWLFAVAGDDISAAALPPGEGVRSHGYSGWYGLEAYRVDERIIELARHHYHDTAALLERAASASGPEPLVIGGHQDTIPQFLAVLPAGLGEHVAGSFAADPDTLTPAMVRDLARPVIEHWVGRRDQQLAGQLLGQPPDGLTVTGLSACLAAASQHAIQLLLVPAGGLVPGYAGRHRGTPAVPPGPAVTREHPATGAAGGAPHRQGSLRCPCRGPRPGLPGRRSRRPSDGIRRCSL